MKAPRKISDYIPEETLRQKSQMLLAKATRDDKTGCMVCSCCKRRGYGWVNISGKAWFAHRIVWAATNGDAPPDKWILHKCDNRGCINPDHLYAGTPTDNNLDVLTRKRRPLKLSQHLAEEIRSAYFQEGILQRAMANFYGVTQSMISKIILNKQWRAVA